MGSAILDELGYTHSVDEDAARAIWREDYDPNTTHNSTEWLHRWLAVLPGDITDAINLSMQGEPIMPPDVTPEYFAKKNATVPSMDHLEIVCRCLHHAMEDKNYGMAAALVHVADRALYRKGQSKPLLRVVSEIQRASPNTAIAPQVIIRQARVMKDDGDLNGAMRVTESVINREINWKFVDENQYEGSKAASLHVQGQIYHILESWREAVTPLVEAIRLFGKSNNKLGLGMCQTLLSRCLPRLTDAEYQDLRQQHPDIFKSDHPCYEGYLQGLGAVSNVQHIDAKFFSAKHQLLADESLLMYAVQKQSETEAQKQSDNELQDLLQRVVEELKKSLSEHSAVHYLNSVESFVEFVRAVFTVSLTLSFSSVSSDQNLARLMEKLSMDLYCFMCNRPVEGTTGLPSKQLKHMDRSVSSMNLALRLLGLPVLEWDSDSAENGAPKMKDENGFNIQSSAAEKSIPTNETVENNQKNTQFAHSEKIPHTKAAAGNKQASANEQSAEVETGTEENLHEPLAEAMDKTSPSTQPRSTQLTAAPPQTEEQALATENHDSKQCKDPNNVVCISPGNGLPSEAPKSAGNPSADSTHHLVQTKFEANTTSVSRILATNRMGEASTFPATRTKTRDPRLPRGSNRRTQRKCVGLAMNMEQLRAATCPALVPSTTKSNFVAPNPPEAGKLPAGLVRRNYTDSKNSKTAHALQAELSQPVQPEDLESLTMSATFLSSAPGDDELDDEDTDDLAGIAQLTDDIGETSSAVEESNSSSPVTPSNELPLSPTSPSTQLPDSLSVPSAQTPFGPTAPKTQMAVRPTPPSTQMSEEYKGVKQADKSEDKPAGTIAEDGSIEKSLKEEHAEESNECSPEKDIALVSVEQNPSLKQSHESQEKNPDMLDTKIPSENRELATQCSTVDLPATTKCSGVAPDTSLAHASESIDTPRERSSALQDEHRSSCSTVDLEATTRCSNLDGVTTSSGMSQNKGGEAGNKHSASLVEHRSVCATVDLEVTTRSSNLDETTSSSDMPQLRSNDEVKPSPQKQEYATHAGAVPSCLPTCDKYNLKVSPSTHSGAFGNDSTASDVSAAGDPKISSPGVSSLESGKQSGASVPEVPSLMKFPNRDLRLHEFSADFLDPKLHDSLDTAYRVFKSDHWRQTVKAQNVHPLVDLTATSLPSLMENVMLGQCNTDVTTTEEFLEKWEPMEDESVHRGVLITFNPETGAWSSQNTLAYLGPQLQTERKGAFRDAFHICVLHQDEPLGRYVGKRYRQQKPCKDYMVDVCCQMMAGYYVTRFNQELSAWREDLLRAQFLPAFHLQLVNKEGEVFDWVNMEPYLHGDFLKLTSNHRYVSKSEEAQQQRGVEVATAFTHFSHVKTHGRLMVVDLQGWVPSAGGGVIYLTDPVLHTGRGRRITSCDRQREGMREFWQHVHPQCNRICRFLGLHEKRPRIDK